MRFIPIYISLLFLCSCYQTETSLTDSLIYCPDKAPRTLNPQINNDVSTLDATTHQLYNRLVKIDANTQRFIGDIATHWEINNAKDEYTFYLRKDVNFHNTDYFTPSRKLNADDVVFSFMRLISQEHPFHTVNSVTQSYLYNHPFSNLIKEVLKIDDYTIRIVLKKANATLLAHLAAHYAIVLSQEYALQLLQIGKPEQIDFFPIGTGPYQFKNRSSRVLRFQAHKFPWQEPANISNLIFDVTLNDSKRYAKLLSGECDIISNPASSQVRQISKNGHVSLSSLPTSNLSFIAFNSQKEPFNKLFVRDALSSAIDINAILHAVFFDTAVDAKALLPEQSWAYNPRIEKNIYDPQNSLDKLIAGGFDFEKRLQILAPAKNTIFNPNFYKTAELIQSNWATLGVKSDIIHLRGTALQQALINNDFDIYLTGTSPFISDPDNLFRPLLSCNIDQLQGNSSRWCESSLQILLDTALLEKNFIQRVKDYYLLQEFLQADRIYLPIAHLLRFDAFNNNISGLKIDAFTGINFHSVIKIAPIKQEISD